MWFPVNIMTVNGKDLIYETKYTNVYFVQPLRFNIKSSVHYDDGC